MFDVYLEIVHRVDCLLKHELKQDELDWRLLNECPACFYKLEDEPLLTFSWLASINGNNSLKHWNPAVYGVVPCEDSCCPHSDLWLPVDNVNKFAVNMQEIAISFTCHCIACLSLCHLYSGCP